MCEELNKELNRGKVLATYLAEHLDDMGAASCEIPVEARGKKYICKCEIEKPKSGKERLMAKYQIVEEWVCSAEKVSWKAYRLDENGVRKNCLYCSFLSAEDCESKLRACLEAKPPQVIKELEI